MCDYSLHGVSSRPAKVGDKVVTRELAKSSTRGFAAVGEHGAKLVIHDSTPEVAVCLMPGTELAFDDDVRYDRAFSLLGKARVNHKVARFRQIDLDDPYVQHDALEFPDGQVLKVGRLAAGQTATVLQLPVAAQHPEPVAIRHAARSDSRLALNRLPVKSGIASILVPNLAAVTLWDALRSAAVGLSTALVQSLRRSKAHEELPAELDAEPADARFDTNVLTATLPNKPAASKPETKTAVKTAA
jgi:hypothetical protein